jgi:hypothetical protein
MRGLEGLPPFGSGEEAPPWEGQPIGEEEEERRQLIGDWFCSTI